MNNNKNKPSAQDEFASRLSQTPIAIVGMASVFADAKSLDDYWDNIVEGIDSIRDIPKDRWNIDDYYDQDPTASDKTYCKRGGFIPEIDFDPMEFGLPPTILELTDIAQLLSLVVAREVLKDAGLINQKDRDNVGIVLGVGGGQKQITALTSRLQAPILKKVLAASGINDKDSEVIIDKFKKAYIPWEENSFPGMLGNVIAGRIANRFNFGGTNCVVDAACAGSLAAVKLAINDLLDYRSDVMISGGVCCDNSPFMYLSFSKTPAFTTDDKIKPFDKDSKGMMVGEGIGMLAFKRLSDAERDGDKIYAVLKGIGSSSDGRFKSIYAPRSEGQAKALKRAYEDANISPQTMGMIEAHGTGTKAGDAGEFAGLSQIFKPHEQDGQHIALGSVKSQIGHTKAAAGAAGLIKSALALYHKVLPPTINVTTPHPELNIEDSAFYINSQARPWLPRLDGEPRRAGVSSFGFGGTNFHVVLEEYQHNYPLLAKKKQPQSLFVDAETKEALMVKLKTMQQQFADDENAFYQYLKNQKSPALPVSLGFVAKDAASAQQQIALALAALVSEKRPQSLTSGVYFNHKLPPSKLKIGGLFSGQGSQYLNMGSTLLINRPSFQTHLAAFDQAFAAVHQKRLSDAIFPQPAFDEQTLSAQTKTLTQTEQAQPAIGCMSKALFSLFESAGLQLDSVAGHSFGELTALWAAKVISNEDFTRLAVARGHSMRQQADKDAGTMLAVMADQQQVSEIIAEIEEVKIANFNAPKQVVIAGKTEAIVKAKKAFQQKKIRSVDLPVSAAFHTELVEHAAIPFKAEIDNTLFNKAKIKVFANKTASPYPENIDDMKQVLAEQLLAPVNFKQLIEQQYQDGIRIFIEFGPKQTLTQLAKKILADKEDVFFITTDSEQDTLAGIQRAYCQLVLLGVDLTDINLFAMPEEKSNSPMSLSLSAASFVSDKTQAAFDEALADDFTIAQAKDSLQQSPENNIQNEQQSYPDKVSENKTLVDSESTLMTNHAKDLNAILAQQAALLETHEAFLDSPKQWTETLTDIIKPNVDLTPETLSMINSVNQYQQETLAVHDKFLITQLRFQQQLNGQINFVSNESLVNSIASEDNSHAAELLQQEQAIPKLDKIVTTQPKKLEIRQSEQQVVTPHNIEIVSDNKVNSSNNIIDDLLAIIANKTGYPLSMLDPSMDIEADLGIDSIKRVEILGEIQDKQAIDGLDPEILSELRTLQAIADYVQSFQPAVESSTVSAIDTKDLTNVLLTIVSEKTGYPGSMIDASMDMESDLGIDSIKRVEILSELQNQFESMPELDTETLAELRTLDEVIEYAQSQVGQSVTSKTSDSAETSAPSDFTPILLDIVAEKTGYPVEMLSLNMDMEADLGIDSIKRVEILGLCQESLGIEIEETSDIAEARTLEEIVDLMSTLLPSYQAEVTINTPITKNEQHEVQATLLAVVADKTGYPVDMIDLDMDLESDLGIDSIKRVEILSHVQDNLSLQEDIAPELLAECRTLNEVLKQLSSDAHNSIPLEIEAASTTQVNNNENVSLDNLANNLLSVVAEKTGYPVEMIALDMDLEADLGIDSIKRVEILSAVQSSQPELPELDAEVLAECRSLGSILSLFKQSSANTEKHTLASQADNNVLSSQSSQLSVGMVTSRTQAIAGLSRFAINGAILLVDEGTELTESLVLYFENTGATVFCLQPYWVTRAIDTKQTVKINSIDEQSIKGIVDSLPPIQGLVISMPVIHAGADDEIESTSLHIKLAFLLASQCQWDNYKQPFCVGIAQTGGRLGFENNQQSQLPTALSGLIKTLDQEWPEVTCRMVDCAVSLSTQSKINAFEQSLFLVNPSIEMGFTDSNQAITLLNTPILLDDFSQTDALLPNDVVLVTGGARGVTAHCIQHLAKETACHYVLLGRTPVEDFPSWAIDATDEADLKQKALQFLQTEKQKVTPVIVNQLVSSVLAQQEIQQTLSSIQNTGAQATYIACDIVDAEALQKSLVDSGLLTEITALIHGAGILKDKRIEDKKLADLNSVFEVKINGLINVLNVINKDKLKQLVLFSSAAGFYGNPGQSDYALANELLNKKAIQFKQQFPQCHVLSMNWGPWDGGMVTGEIKKRFESRGVEIIDKNEGANILMKAMQAEGNPFQHLIIGNSMKAEVPSILPDKNSLITKPFVPSQLPFLEDHVIGGNAVLPTVCAMAWMINAAQSIYPDYRFISLSDYQLYKGIIVDGNEPNEVSIAVDRVKTTESDITLNIKIANGKVAYYGAQIHMTQAHPQPTSILADLTLNTAATDATCFYQDGTLFHGDSLQVMQNLHYLDETGLLIECKVPLSSENKTGEFPIDQVNVLANDAVYQAMLIWVKQQKGMGSLPSRTGQWVRQREIKAGETFYIQLQVDKVTKTKLVADIHIIDNKNTVISQIKSAEVTISKGLAALFTSAA